MARVKRGVTTHARHRKVIKAVIQEVEDRYGLKVFKDYIPDNIVVEEAHHNHLPVSLYAPRSKAAVSYEALAEELIL